MTSSMDSLLRGLVVWALVSIWGSPALAGDRLRVKSTPPDDSRAATRLTSQNTYWFDTWSDRSLSIGVKLAALPKGGTIQNYAVSLSDLELQDEIPLDGRIWKLVDSLSGNRSAQKFQPHVKVFEAMPSDAGPAQLPLSTAILCPIKSSASIELNSTEANGAVATTELLKFTLQDREIAGTLHSSRVRYRNGVRDPDKTVVSRIDKVAAGVAIRLSYMNRTMRITEVVGPNPELRRFGWIVLEEVADDPQADPSPSQPKP